MSSHHQTVERLLSDPGCPGFHMSFGHCSEVGVLKSPELISAGVSVCGKDLSREKEILDVFKNSGGSVIDASPKMRIGGKTRRITLLKFKNLSDVAVASKALERWSKGRSPLSLHAISPAILWQCIEVVPPKRRRSK
jgi:hypothetical protein